MDKKSLEYCRDLALEIADLDRRIDQLRAKAISRKWPDGLPHSNFAADRLSGIVSKIADLEAVRGPKAVELMELRRAIEAAMSRLEPTERRLIRLRYFDGLPWEEVAEAMSYCERHVRRIAESGLAKMSGNVR